MQTFCIGRSYKKNNNNALMQIYLSIEYFALKFALITYYVNQ